MKRIVIRCRTNPIWIIKWIVFYPDLLAVSFHSNWRKAINSAVMKRPTIYAFSQPRTKRIVQFLMWLGNESKTRKEI